jgi:mannose-6-phosphate isomerase-like protein (cupin superfamily)
MPKASKASATKIADYGVAEDRSTDVAGYTIDFVTIRETHDLAPMLKSLPGGNCSCPHWGYVLKGRVIVRYDDHEEVLEAGDAFYMTPGHAPEAEAGTELIQFSPADELAATEAAIATFMQTAHDG